jgi:hypothetical protein
MPRKRAICADCSKKLQGFEADSWYYQGRCQDCRKNYEACIRCHEIRPLKDMRQSYCRWCRSAYDRDRWARQRAAREAGSDQIAAETPKAFPR